MVTMFVPSRLMKVLYNKLNKQQYGDIMNEKRNPNLSHFARVGGHSHIGSY